MSQTLKNTGMQMKTKTGKMEKIPMEMVSISLMKTQVMTWGLMVLVR